MKTLACLVAVLLLATLVGCGEDEPTPITLTGAEKEGNDWLLATGVTLPGDVGGLDNYTVNEGVNPQVSGGATSQDGTLVQTGDAVATSVTLPSTLKAAGAPTAVQDTYNVYALIIGQYTAVLSQFTWSAGSTFTNALVFSEATNFFCIIVQRIGTNETVEPVLRTVFYKATRATAPAKLVFYDKGFYSDGWRYLEAAPTNWQVGGDSQASYHTTWSASWEWGIVPTTYDDFGAGYENTVALRAYAGANIANFPAINALSGIEINGDTEWYLPSVAELVQLQAYTTEFEMQNGTYWSSSLGGTGTGLAYDYSGRKIISVASPGTTYYVRPIRRF